MSSIFPLHRSIRVFLALLPWKSLRTKTRISCYGTGRRTRESGRSESREGTHQRYEFDREVSVSDLPTGSGLSTAV